MQQQNGLFGFLSLQIEIVVIGPPQRLPTTTALSLPFSAVISINNDTTSHPWEIQSKSCRMRRRWWDRMSPRSFKGDDFWEGGDGEEEEGGKWKGWRRRRRRRRYPEKWTYLDAFLIFKILRPYGWSLPVILLSWLAASGPKAFFISLVLTFALSAAALVVQFLWPGPGAEFDSQGNGSKRKRRSAGRVSRSGMAGGRNEEMRSGQKRASAYDSWLDLGLDEPSFGGWVESEEERFSNDTGQRKGKIESSKGSRESLREVGSEAEAPLLLRLLVAMFPFVASWTKLFW